MSKVQSSFDCTCI